MKKPSWLYDKKAGHTIHLFMYGYMPTCVSITRTALRILSEKLNQTVIAQEPPAGFPKTVGNTLRIRHPVKYSAGTT